MSAPASSSGSASKGRKRSSGASAAAPSSAKRTEPRRADAQMQEEDGADLEFEDPYGDEEDEEDAAIARGGKPSKTKAKRKKGKAGAGAAAAAADGQDDESMEDVDDPSEGEEEILDEAAAARVAAEEEAAAEAAKKAVKYVWRPGTDSITNDEKLDYDSTAYHMLHRMRVDWPCLSFDVLPDQLGAFRNKYPHTAYIVSGTQADHASKNKVMLLKLSDLHRTKHDERDEDDDAEDSDSDPEDLDDDPILEERSFAHPGGVNRVRVCAAQPNLLATHADTAHLHIWNIEAHVAALDSAPAAQPPPTKHKPLFSFAFPSRVEGYALAWSPHTAGRLLVGDGNKAIHLLEPGSGGSWSVDGKSFAGHANSVEDLVWSPSESSVFASASSDKTIRIWDTRVREKCQQWIAAHKTDVNVMDWNDKVQHLIVSGADDGSIKIWDLRNFKSGSPAASFNWHRDAVTSVEWHPHEESCLAASAADDSLSVWDMALEHDELPGHGAQLQEEVPPQLFFVHQGQKQIKELHWHKQIPNCLISTAEDGFNIFKPSNMD